MIKLEMMRTFQTVAEKGSLNAAADVLGRTPSAISMTLSQLEDHVGAPLFETDRKNRLTPLGQLVLQESSRANEAFARSVDAIARHAVSTAGTVRLAVVPSATVTILPEIITDFRAQHPDVRLEISDVDSATVKQRVKMDYADIGILSAAGHDSTTGVPIFEDELGIVCQSGGPISTACHQNRSISWSVMKREPLIANPLCEQVKYPVISELLLNCRLEARNTTALLSFVRAGLGATILPRSAIYPGTEGIDFWSPDDGIARRRLCKIRDENRHLGPAAEVFWAALLEL